MTLPVLLSFILAALVPPSIGLRFEQQYIGHNLNENETAIEAKDFWGIWDNHTFQPSPANWRMPTFVLTIDRLTAIPPTTMRMALCSRTTGWRISSASEETQLVYTTIWTTWKAWVSRPSTSQAQ